MSEWSDYLDRAQLARAKRKRNERRRRSSAASHTELLEYLLGRIVDRGDVIAEVELDRRSCRDTDAGVCLLVTIEASDFHRLCAASSSFEDLEDTDGTEYGQDEEPNLTGAAGYAASVPHLHDLEEGEPLAPATVAAARDRYHNRTGSGRRL